MVTVDENAFISRVERLYQDWEVRDIYRNLNVPEYIHVLKISQWTMKMICGMRQIVWLL